MHADDAGSLAEGTRVRDTLLVLLALGAGIVDAISLTTLGVFTAAVTGNVVLVGIALGDSDLHTALRAGLAVAGFAIGVLLAERALGGKARPESRPSRAPAVLGAIAAVQLTFLVIWLISDGLPDGVALDLLASASALAMGGQTAATRVWHTAVTTTFVSGMFTVLLSELVAATGSRSDRLRRLYVIIAVAAGATVGAVMLNHAREEAPILPLALTVLVATGTATLLTRRTGRDSRGR